MFTKQVTTTLRVLSNQTATFSNFLVVANHPAGVGGMQRHVYLVISHDYRMTRCCQSPIYDSSHSTQKSVQITDTS